MTDFIEIKSIGKENQKKILEEIERRIARKKKEGIFTEKEIQEIEEMRLRPLADVLDVQSVYENLLYKENE